MSNVALPRPSLAARNARLAVSVFFFTNGVVIASLVPHFPGIKAELGLSNALYGLLVISVPIGAMVAGPAAGWLIRRLGSAKTSFLFTLFGAAVLLLVPFAHVAPLFVAAFFALGALDSIADVGQNAHGLRVQKEYGRSILNKFHAIWSIGAATGGAIGALAISIDMSRTVHLSLMACVIAALASFAYAKRLPTNDAITQQSPKISDDAAPASSASPLPADHVAEHGDSVATSSATQSPVEQAAPGALAAVKRPAWLLLAALSLLAISGALVEDSGSTWAAVYLGESLGAAASIATFGYIALVGSQFIGRMIGDNIVDRLGQRATAAGGGLLIAVGMGIALAFPSIPTTIMGFALAGFGSATLVPAAYQGADEVPGLKHGTGLTIVSWLLRVGFLVSPPIVGFVADNVSLRVGLLVLPIAGVLTIVCAQVLSSHSARALTTQEPHQK